MWLHIYIATKPNHNNLNIKFYLFTSKKFCTIYPYNVLGLKTHLRDFFFFFCTTRPAKKKAHNEIKISEIGTLSGNLYE